MLRREVHPCETSLPKLIENSCIEICGHTSNHYMALGCSLLRWEHYNLWVAVLAALILISTDVGLIALPIMAAYLMVIGNSRQIMGEHKLGWLTNFFLAETALVWIACSVLFFYGLASG